MYCRVYREDATGVQLRQGEGFRFARYCQRMSTLRQNAFLEMADNSRTRTPADDDESLELEAARDEAANRRGNEDDDWLPAGYLMQNDNDELDGVDGVEDNEEAAGVADMDVIL